MAIIDGDTKILNIISCHDFLIKECHGSSKPTHETVHLDDKLRRISPPPRFVHPYTVITRM